MATDFAEIRQRLDDLGERRSQAETASEALTQEIKDALKVADASGVTKAEIARRLRVHRTTLYRVYDA